jgi:ParB family chromosome partitioning protein
MTLETTAAPIVRAAPLDSVLRDPDQPRKRFEPSSLDELAANIWMHGLTQPISVTPGEDGCSVIFVGERRFRSFQQNRERAARLLADSPDLPDDHPAHRYRDWTVIPVIDVEPIAADIRLLRQLSENDQRDDLSLYERALAITKAVSLSGLKGKEFAARHGIPTNLQSTCKGLANSKGPTKLALERGLLKDAYAANLFQQLPADLQEDLIERATEEETFLTRVQLRRILDRVLDADKKAEQAAAAGPDSPKGGDDPDNPAGAGRSGGEGNPRSGSSRAAAGEPPPAAGPVMSVDALLWLHGHVEEVNAGDDEPLRLAALEALRAAVLTSAPCIVFRETLGVLSLPALKNRPGEDLSPS